MSVQIERLYDGDIDGISDTDEGRNRDDDTISIDTDRDNLYDYADTDSDNDGIPDDEEAGNDQLNARDTDNDGTPDYRDRDSDGDNILDLIELSYDGMDGDSDGDMIPDYLDGDSDNDRIPDVIENESTPRLLGGENGDLIGNFGSGDGNGIDDNVDIHNAAIFTTNINDPDASKILTIDTNTNGVHDPFEAANSDGDALPNHLDLDSDADGIIDLIESQMNEPEGMDSDSDGIDDAYDFDATNVRHTDDNANGINDVEEPLNTDDDIITVDGRSTPKYDFIDQDSDNDGIADLHESPVPALTGADTDGDGIDDGIDNNLSADGDIDPSNLPVDFDGDAVPDYLDLDSDNDSVFDVAEVGLDDINDNALIDNDADEGSNADMSPLPNFRNVQSNGTEFDLVVNITTLGLDPIDFDSDINGVIDDDKNTDTDGDGIADLLDFFVGHGSILDSDGDMVEDLVDIDDDNDGIPDVIECAQVDITEAICEVTVDTDGDGVSDNLDLDSDNDALSDFLEARGTVSDLDATFDEDNDGRLDSFFGTIFVFSSVNGFHLGIDLPFLPLDSDDDGLADYRDLDSDNDTLFDLFESVADVNEYLSRDADQNGISDAFDPLTGVVATLIRGFDSDGGGQIDQAGIDSDGDGLSDFRDLDSDNDGFSDQLESGGSTSAEALANLRRSQATNETIDSTSGAGSANILSLVFLLIALFVQKRRGDQVKKHLSTLVASVVFCCFILPTHVEARTNCGYDRDIDSQFKDCWFAGFGAGVSEVSPEGNSNGWSVSDDSSSAIEIYVGKHFSPRWFADFKYTDLGEAKFSNEVSTITAAFPGTGVDYTAYSLSAGYFWLNQNRSWNVYTKLGVVAVQADLSDASNTINFDDSSGANVALSAGVQYRWQESPWFVRLNYDSYSSDISYFSLAFSRYFGGRSKASIVIADSVSHEPKIVESKAVQDTAVAVDSNEVSQPVLELNTEQAVEGVVTQTAVKVDCKAFDGIIERIQFNPDASELTEVAQQILLSYIRRFKASPQALIEVAGHATVREQAKGDLALSRSKAVYAFLVAAGVSEQQLAIKGYGATQPVIRSRSEAVNAINRRVEFVTLQKDSCQ